MRNVSSSIASMLVDSKASSGKVSASKKSGERRWASRWGSLVSTEADRTVPRAFAEERSSLISSTPSKSLNSPRTGAVPLCLTAKATLEGAAALRRGEVVADLQHAFEVLELATDGGDAHVLDSEADLGVRRVDGPGADGNSGGGGDEGGHEEFFRVVAQSVGEQLL